MKSKILFFLLLISYSVKAQFDNVSLEPGDTFAFIHAIITNPNNTPYVGVVIFQGDKPYHKVKSKTDKKGFVKASVPISDTYTLFCGRTEPAFRKAKVGDFPYVIHEVRTYTHRFVQFTFNYRNPGGIPIPNEKVDVRCIRTGKIYSDTTDAKGRAIFELPFEPVYEVGVKYHDNVKNLEVLDVNKEYKVMSMDFTWMGSKEKEYRGFLSDSLTKVAYKATVLRIDSLLKFGSPEQMLKEDLEIPIDFDSTAWICDILKKKAAIYKQQYLQDANFFVAKKKAVLAVLSRLNSKYRDKIIVTDITGSMSPYMEQVLLWHALNFAEGITTKYVFFNDGNMTPDDKKVIGKTGGLYTCQGQFKDFSIIVEMMRLGIKAGYGGDSPENDVEALLSAIQKRTKEEIILIADNFSSMRDFSLIKSLHLPIRVILCGIENGQTRMNSSETFWGEVNEEYLTLAYKTGGSIHTLNEDIYDLNKMTEGKKIIINAVEYVLNNGRFLRSNN